MSITDLVGAAMAVCGECAANDDADYLPHWGWHHGRLGVEVRPCRAWKLWEAIARGDGFRTVECEPLRANRILRVAKALSR